MKIGLLECDHVAERFRHIAGDYRDMFTTLFRESSPQISWQFFDVCHGEFPASVEACDAYLTTGSRFSAYDDCDWIQTLKGFIRHIHKANLPFVGICFGHQILAEALGGRVEKAESSWGAGIHRVKIIQHEPWMEPGQRSCGLQFMHQDQVVRMPQESIVLGRTEDCPVAVFRVGETMLGIQPHPEFPKTYCEVLIRDRIELIGETKALAALNSLSLTTDEEIVAKWISNFLAARRA
jgi:GMP synthase-like glutamine amidotransferase